MRAPRQDVGVFPKQAGMFPKQGDVSSRRRARFGTSGRCERIAPHFSEMRGGAAVERGVFREREGMLRHGSAFFGNAGARRIAEEVGSETRRRVSEASAPLSETRARAAAWRRAFPKRGSASRKRRY